MWGSRDFESKERAALPARGLRPKPIEDIQYCARKEQAIASRAVRNDENSCIDEMRRCGIDTSERAADSAAGVLDGEGRPRERERRELVDHAIGAEARKGAAPLRLDGRKTRQAVKVRCGRAPKEGEHEARPRRHVA